jgi:hypothetical protein
VPYEVDEEGNYVGDIDSGGRRDRRDVNVSEETKFLSKCFGFSAFKEKFHLCVVRNIDLISPNFTVETIERDRKTNKGIPETHCYWTGFLKSHPNSSVAISTCYGLVRAFFISAIMAAIIFLHRCSYMDRDGLEVHVSTHAPDMLVFITQMSIVGLYDSSSNLCNEFWKTTLALSENMMLTGWLSENTRYRGDD